MNGPSLLEKVNHGALATLLESVREYCSPARKVLLLSPSRSDYRFAKTVFPKSLIYVAYIENWDLEFGPPRGFPRCDVAIASNVLMYAQHPDVWIEHVLDTANLFAMQDVKYRKRSADSQCSYLGDDGDSVRYTLDPEMTSQPSFALSWLPHEVVRFFEFEGVGNPFHAEDDPPIHVCAAIAAANRRPTPVGAGDLLYFASHNFFVASLLHAGRRLALKIGIRLGRGSRR